MLQYKKIGTSERIDLDKTDKSKEFEVYNYNYFNNGFKFDSKVCNHCNRGVTDFDLKIFAIVNARSIWL